MKKIIPVVAGAIIAGVMLLMSVAAPDSVKQLMPAENLKASESPIKTSGTEGIVPEGYVYAKVTRIVDGDTLTAEYKGGEYKVRLLCIDTPETVKSGVDVQPYGKQATDQLKSMVLNREVTLIFEKDIDDRYDRLLAYIMLEDGTCVNAVLIEEGFARVETIKPNTVHEDYFNELQDKAIKEKKGLWSLPAKKRPFIKNDKGYYVPQYIENDAA